VDNDGNATTVYGSESGHIKEGMEYRFFMYRHWSLFDAMLYSPYIASKMCVWQAQGTSKLQV
jgi:cell division control protein 45